MIAVLVATRTEARHLLRHMAAVKREGIFHYRGSLAGKPAALFLTRPGVASREQLRRFLRLYTTDLVIAAGACGSLTGELRPLQAVQIAAVTNADRQWIQLPGGTVRCVSVDHLVASDEQKQLLRERTGADVIDMETWAVASVLREYEFASRRFLAVRIVDDLPGDQLWLAKEQRLRDLTARRPSARLTPAEIVRFGLWDFFAIKQRRKRVSAALYRAVAAAAAVRPAG